MISEGRDARLNRDRVEFSQSSRAEIEIELSKIQNPEPIFHARNFHLRKFQTPESKIHLAGWKLKNPNSKFHMPGQPEQMPESRIRKVLPGKWEWENTKIQFPESNSTQATLLTFYWIIYEQIPNSKLEISKLELGLFITQCMGRHWPPDQKWRVCRISPQVEFDIWSCLWVV